MAFGRPSTDNNQVRFRLFCNATQNLGNVAAGDNRIRLDAGIFAELGHPLRSSSRKHFFQIGLYIFPSPPIYLEPGNNVAESEPGAKFGCQTPGPTHRACAMRTKIDGAKNVANLKFVRFAVFEMSTRPYGAPTMM